MKDFRCMGWYVVVMLVFIVGIGVASAGELSLTWTYPTKNVDGTDVPATGAGAIVSSKVEWGTCAGTAFGTKAGEATIPAPTKTYSVPNLAPGTHCARMLVTNSYGVASDFTAAVSRTVDAPKPLPPVITTATVVRVWTAKGLGMVAGQVPLDTPCGALVRDTRKADWYRVPRSVVRLNAEGRRLKPTATLVAKCG